MNGPHHDRGSWSRRDRKSLLIDDRRAQITAAVIATAFLLFHGGSSAAGCGGTEGTVRFFVATDSGFDRWTARPNKRQQEWMRSHYSRMLSFSPYFDSRLSWYPDAWVYVDAYAIYTNSQQAEKNSEWILRDASGSELYIPWGCSGGKCPQFAADFGNPDFQDWWISKVEKLYAKGYRGIFVDDVNLEWRISNNSGDITKPIDPRTGAEMTLADYRRYFAELMERLRDALPDAEIAHNAIWFASPADDPFIIRQMQAADYLVLERGVSDGGIRAGDGKYGFNSFLAYIDRAHALGASVIMLDDDDDSKQTRDYELAFYYLVNQGKDMLSADGDRDRMAPGRFWSGYLTDLGAALGPRHEWQSLLRRDFECGMVLLNGPDMPEVTVRLDGSYQDLSGKTVSSVTLNSASGEVLTRTCGTGTSQHAGSGQ